MCFTKGYCAIGRQFVLLFTENNDLIFIFNHTLPLLPLHYVCKGVVVEVVVDNQPFVIPLTLYQSNQLKC